MENNFDKLDDFFKWMESLNQKMVNDFKLNKEALDQMDFDLELNQMLNDNDIEL